MELGLIVEGGQDGHDIPGPDAYLRLIMALPDGPSQSLTETGLEARLELAVHV
jgi:hypothetical protein